MEGTLLQGQLAAGGKGRLMSILEHNYAIIDGEGEGVDRIKGCS